jgi:hypothetical protein
LYSHQHYGFFRVGWQNWHLRHALPHTAGRKSIAGERVVISPESLHAGGTRPAIKCFSIKFTCEHEHN